MPLRRQQTDFAARTHTKQSRSHLTTVSAGIFLSSILLARAKNERYLSHPREKQGMRETPRATKLSARLCGWNTRADKDKNTRLPLLESRRRGCTKGESERREEEDI